MDRRMVRWALGSLWVLDGLLQLQPGMFRMAMVQAVMLPATQGNPAWANAPLELVIRIFSRHLVAANLAVALVQLGIGAALLATPGVGALWASLAWSVLLWPFGQAFGGVLSGSPSLVVGSPGSAVLYALLTWAAWPDGQRAALRDRALAWVLGGIWALGAFWQAHPAFFRGPTLAGLVTGNAPGQPAWLAAALDAVGHLLLRHPVAWDIALVVLMAAVALGIWGGARRAALLLSFVLSAAFWVFGQAFGMVFTGMATDPNTAPLLAVLGLAVWPRRRRVGRAPQQPESAPAPVATAPRG
jgi:hypothetical protein